MATKYPYLLITKEKHCDGYYLIAEPGDYRAVLLQLFKERLDQGWY